MALHLGVRASAWLWRADDADEDKTFHGRCMSSEIAEHNRRLIGVGGAIGEMLWRNDDLDLADFMADVHEHMSPADCELAGFPHADDDTLWAEGSQAFHDLVLEVDALLRGALAQEWRAHVRDLKREACKQSG